MADLLGKLAEYDNLASKSTSAAPEEAGAGHYLKRGALQGISALADAVPNLYNLGKVAYGVSAIPEVLAQVTGKNEADFLPEVGRANPIANFLLESYGLDKPVTPSSKIGGKYGAAALEGLGAAVSQGPMSMVKAAPMAMAKEFATQEAKNAALGSLAGLGSQAGSDATNGNPYGALAGGLLTGVVAPATFIRNGGLVVGGVRTAIDTAKDIKARQAIIDSASGKVAPAFSSYVDNTLKHAASGTTNAAENLTTGLRLSDMIPGFKPSVAEMSNSPGLLDMQKKFALLNPENLNAETSRVASNETAIQNFRRSVVPEPENPSTVRSSVNQSLADYEKVLAGKAEDVSGQLPVVDQLSSGAKLADIARAEKSAARPPIQAAYQKAFDLAGDSTVPASGIVSKVEQILGEPLSQIKPSTAPQTVSAIKRIFGDKTGELEGRSIPPDLMSLMNVGGKTELTLGDLHDIRVAIGQDVASASRSSDPAAATRLYNLGKVTPEVDAAIASLPDTAKNAYAAATAKYRDEYVPRFKEGANSRVFKETSLNEPRILPDKMVSEYFKPDSQGGMTRADQFSKLYGNNPEALDATKQGILDIYRQKVVDPTTGAIKLPAHDSFLRDYGRTMDAFKSNGVDVRTSISKIGQEAAKVSEAMDKLKSLSSSLKYDTVGELASSALSSPKVMGNTLARLNDANKATFNAILLDKAFEAGTSTGMVKFLADNQKTLSMTVPKEQLTAMNDIAQALAMTERAPLRGSLSSGGADMLKNASGVSTATVFSQIRAVTGGRSSPEWAAINLAMPALNKLTQTSFSNVMESALHSKQSAVSLRNYLMSKSPQEANKWATQLLNGMRAGGKLLWSARGPIVSNFLGPQNYPKNMAITGSTLKQPFSQDQNAVPPEPTFGGMMSDQLNKAAVP